MSGTTDDPAESPGESAETTGDGDVEPGVRRRGKRILDENPDLSRGAFAGRLFDELNTPPGPATDLYDSLTAGDGGGRDGGAGDQDATGRGPEAVGERDQDGDDGTDATESDPTPADPPAATERAESGRHATADRIAEHYARADAAGVYDALGAVDADIIDSADRDLSCIGIPDFAGWFRTKDGRGRAHALAEEFDIIRDRLDRCMYGTLNYAPASWFLEAWERYRWVENEDDDGRSREWASGESPTPGYGDMEAFALFADVDLTDDLKRARPADGAPTDRIEGALRRWVDAFAELAGGREHVFALDSVGGAYLFVAPTATTPIAAAFDREDRAAIFEELCDRMNDWVADTSERVAAATALRGKFEADAINHNNRQYKLPLSLHKSLDGVVTPLDTADPSYQFTPLEAADREVVADAREWADQFTADHTDAVDAVVAGLWPDAYDAAGGWRDALAAWLDDQHTEEEQQQERERHRIPANEIPDDLETTDDLEVINSKIEAIAVDELIEQTIGAAVTGERTEESSNGIRFNPPWRGSESGQSCMADHKKFHDPKHSAGGGALRFIAAERGIVRGPGDTPTGNDYWKAVNALRNEGYHIPYFEGTGERKHPDVLRLFTEPETEEEKKRQLARALYADE